MKHKRYTVHLARNGTFFSRYFWQVLWQQVDNRDQRIVEEHIKLQKLLVLVCTAAEPHVAFSLHPLKSVFFPELKKNKTTPTAFATRVISKHSEFSYRHYFKPCEKFTTSKAVKQTKETNTFTKKVQDMNRKNKKGG